MLFSDLQTQCRPPRDLPVLNTGSRWTPPAQLPSLKGVKRLGFDTETYDPDLEALGPGVRRNGRVVGMSIAIDDDGPRMYIPVGHQGGGNLDQAVVRRWAKSELENFEGELIGANILYDLDYMASPAWDVHFKRVKKIHDVLVAEPLIDEWRRRYNLDSVAQTHLGETKAYGHVHVVMEKYGWKTEGEFKKNLWRLPASDVGEYAEGDADLPMRVLPIQLKLLEEDEQLHIYEEIERPLIPILLDMRRRGVRVNLKRAHEVHEMLIRERDRWLKRVRYLAGPKAELLSPDSFADALTERGLEFPRTPKTDAPSITKPWLEANVHDELVAAIMAGRRVNTVIQTFMEGSIFTHAIHGRVHCEFNQLKREDDGGGMRGTIARFSSSNPNMQQIPARESKADSMLEIDEAIGDAVRSIFEPEDGEDWQRDDFSQVEYRFSVNYAVGPGAEEAREMYRNDPKTDFHVFCGDMIGVDREDKRKRKGVKNLNFAKGYGAGAAKIAMMLGWSIAEAKEFIETYDTKLPFMKETYNRAARSAEQHGYVLTVASRKCRFPFWEPARNPHPKRPGIKDRDEAIKEYGRRIKRADTYKAMNRKMQGSGAELMKKSMVEAHAAGVCDVIGPFLLTVHDELDNSIPRTKAGDEAGLELVRIMESCVKIQVPLLVESQRGPNWGACV